MITIIGLIVGGVMVGRSLIRGYELSAAVSDAEKYKSAFLLFRDQYGQLPGDFSGGSSLWPSCVTDAYTSCDGNNNGKIEWGAATFECNRAWEHMSLAGVLDQTLVGLWCKAGTCGTILGYNVPAGRMSGTGYQVSYVAASKKHNIAFGQRNVPAGSIGASTMSPEEAYSVDMKFDDGVAATGRLRTTEGYLGGVVTPGGCLTGGVYNKNSTVISCIFNFYIID